MAQEGAQQIGLVLNGAGGTASPAGETRQVERGGVGERIGLQVAQRYSTGLSSGAYGGR